MRFEGVYVANVTPFTASGELSLTNLKDHLDFLLQAKVDGFVPCGTTGEASTISPKEWATVVATVVEAARANGKKVIAGCGSNCTATAVQLTRNARDLGADGALVVTPYYNKPTARGVLAHYLEIADKSPIPIVLYNVPGRTNVPLSIETIVKLFEHENIVAIKEASGQHGLWLSISERCDLKKKALMAGDDDAFATIRRLGGTGIISATANVIPEAFVQIHALCNAGKWEEAMNVQRRILPVVRAMFVETNPAPAKYALKILRRYENTLRLPLVPVMPETETLISAALNERGGA